MRRTLLLIIILIGFFVKTEAQLKTARVFGDHMVLQRNQSVPVWGTSGKNSKITLSFNGQQVSAKADAGVIGKLYFSP